MLPVILVVIMLYRDGVIRHESDKYELRHLPLPLDWPAGGVVKHLTSSTSLSKQFNISRMVE